MNVREPGTNEGSVSLIYFVCLFVFPFTDVFTLTYQKQSKSAEVHVFACFSKLALTRVYMDT